MTELTAYAIRISPRAARDIVAASAGMAALAGPSAAAEWEQGIFEAIRTLGTLPRCLPLAPENDALIPDRDVRQMIYQRRRRGAAYRVLFRAEESSTEGPTVFILHVRHAGQPAATARELQNEDA